MDQEQTYILFFQKLALTASILLIALCIGLFFYNTFFTEWKQVQNQYFNLLHEQQAKNSTTAALKKEIHQINLPHFDRIDRCTTCHNALQNQNFKNAPQPYRAHPGNFLQQHAVQKFGCTICHGGQGQALDKKHAFARHENAGWDHPLIEKQYLQSACGMCHLAIYSENSTLTGTDTFTHGHQLFQQEGCLGCHKARNVGGAVGPDLTMQGDKKRSEYNFKHIRGEASVTNWLREHFKDPETVSPGSQMLAVNLKEKELDALITFTLGLQKPDIPLHYFSNETLQELKGKRESLLGQRAFLSFCSACHGKNGDGKSYKTFKMGVPAIFGRHFNATASPDFIAFTLLYGRNNRQMAAWQPHYSGMFQHEFDSLVTHLRTQFPAQSDWHQVKQLGANLQRGEQLYAENCQTCHGKDGNDYPIISVQNPSMLQAAGDEFLYKTLLNGRRNTAMPRWKNFTSQEIKDIIHFLRKAQPKKQQAHITPIPPIHTAAGDSLYHFLCSRCHGNYGQGSTGPALFNADFEDAASDAFLFKMIAQGRKGTAMFGWQSDVYGTDRLNTQQIRDLVSFLRFSGTQQLDVIYPGANFGNAEHGNILFAKHCATCHGKQALGDTAPALNNQEFLNSATNGFLVATMTLGRDNTEMPAWGSAQTDSTLLALQQRLDIAAFVRTMQTFVITR